ncbi:MAG: SDR family NAD(P)-dependent oxidoreductase [Luminiphilus sp.]|nr:SDR family NAD(P)-dependent oxidoreductase [Luminiphilus sp.]
MIQLHEQITVERSPFDCFLYLADLRTLVEWDQSVRRVTKLSRGPIGKGTNFRVVVSFGRFPLSMTYTVTQYVPRKRIVITGRSFLLTVTDTIDFSETPNGTVIDYRADFHFHLGLESLIRRKPQSTATLGKVAIEGLKKALSDEPAPPAISPENQKNDRRTFSALRCFTRYGYLTGLKRWAPMSERLEGRHIVITGANSGIGLASAIALAEAGASLTLVVRNAEKAASTRDILFNETGRDDFHFEHCDLSLVTATEQLINRLLAQGKTIDVLINNAGALFNDHIITSEGLENSFALLLLTPWRLSEGLLPLLENHETTARVINVVSGGMYAERLNMKRLNVGPDGYRGARAYAQCKRALSILTELWAQAWCDSNIAVNAMHPGWSDTPGVQKSLPGFRFVTQSVLRDHVEGADTIVWLARSRQGDDLTGKLFLDREPRSTYLLGNHVEPEDERAKLTDFLRQNHESVIASDAG